MNYTEKGRILRAFIIEQKNEEACALIQEIGVNYPIDATVTPVLLACIHNNIQVLDFCLKNGGDANAAFRPSVEKLPALSIVCRAGNLELAELLLAHNAQPNAKDAEGVSVLQELLHAAKNRAGLLTLLLKNGADRLINMTFNNGETFLETITNWDDKVLLAVVEKV